MANLGLNNTNNTKTTQRCNSENSEDGRNNSKVGVEALKEKTWKK